MFGTFYNVLSCPCNYSPLGPPTLSKRLCNLQFMIQKNDYACGYCIYFQRIVFKHHLICLAEVIIDVQVSNAMCANMWKEHQMIQELLSQHMRENITMKCQSRTQFQWPLKQIHCLLKVKTSDD